MLSAAKDGAEILSDMDDSGYRIVVNKSTVPVGTADKVQAVFGAHDDELVAA